MTNVAFIVTDVCCSCVQGLLAVAMFEGRLSLRKGIFWTVCFRRMEMSVAGNLG